jgi:hypothetical protein
MIKENMCCFTKNPRRSVARNLAGYSRFPAFFTAGDLYLTKVWYRI